MCARDSGPSGKGEPGGLRHELGLVRGNLGKWGGKTDDGHMQG